ncbi:MULTISPECIES: SRPBCC family protein [unclassified Sinorhizobium]|uniref:SRPBCC family protein n=1 Tax=unclassified Sinorhizobium TaxID=2613772 RepID=UPI0035251B62
MSEPTSTVVSKVIDASPEAIYGAFLDHDALAVWLPPDSMKGIVHSFEGHEGGAFRMSLIYPEDEQSWQGKSSERTDTFQGRFVKLTPNERIVWATEFESEDPSFSGEMTITTTLEPADNGTKVTMTCENIPRGVRPEDNETGCRSTLEKLAAFLRG